MSKAFYDWRQIPDGPRLAVATVADSECVALSIYIPAGSRDESDYPIGLAHFLEHMVFKGTERKSARELSFEIENAGGQLNACTSEDGLRGTRRSGHAAGSDRSPVRHALARGLPRE
jgi:predicted Zn-dependent peptidase